MNQPVIKLAFFFVCRMEPVSLTVLQHCKNFRKMEHFRYYDNLSNKHRNYLLHIPDAL